MPEPADSFSLFSLETMAGVFLGSRTPVWHRFRLQAVRGEPGSSRWALLLWTDAPSGYLVYLDRDANGRWQPPPLLERSALPQERATLHQEVATALQALGWQLRSCGTCGFWQPVGESAAAHDLPMGRCSWRSGAQAAACDNSLQLQAAMALECSQWQVKAVHPDAAHQEDSRPAPQAERAHPPLQRMWQRMWQQMWQWLWGKPSATADAAPQERSGVSAGTEPCFACWGRLANLGALVVDTDKDDQRTFSVWRCRVCRTLYLNDWIDSWERDERLTTTERYFRLPPGEATEILTLVTRVEAGADPAGRRQRRPQRVWLEEFVAQRRPLSHQSKQGR